MRSLNTTTRGLSRPGAEFRAVAGRRRALPPGRDVRPTLCFVTGDAVGVVAATTLASGVEFVEALTIVLAMGTTRGWRSTLIGVGAALAALAVTTVLGGYALAPWLPEAVLQLVVGTLLLIFGLQWLRKAILRAAGLKALHDEDDIFREEGGRAGRRRGARARARLVRVRRVASRASSSRVSRSSSSCITFGLNANSIAAGDRRRRDRAASSSSPPGSRCTGRSRACRRTRSSSSSACCSSTFGTFWASRGWACSAPDDASLELARRRRGPAGPAGGLVALAWATVTRRWRRDARRRSRNAVREGLRALLVGLHRRRRLAHRRRRGRRRSPPARCWWPTRAHPTPSSPRSWRSASSSWPSAASPRRRCGRAGAEPPQCAYDPR